MLSEQLIRELQEILHEEYGADISEHDAAKTARWLAGYFDALAEASRRAKPLQRQCVRGVTDAT
jgi:hypothetical protein